MTGPGEGVPPVQEDNDLSRTTTPERHPNAPTNTAVERYDKLVNKRFGVEEDLITRFGGERIQFTVDGTESKGWTETFSKNVFIKGFADLSPGQKNAVLNLVLVFSHYGIAMEKADKGDKWDINFKDKTFKLTTAKGEVREGKLDYPEQAKVRTETVRALGPLRVDAVAQNNAEGRGKAIDPTVVQDLIAKGSLSEVLRALYQKDQLTLEGRQKFLKGNSQVDGSADAIAGINKYLKEMNAPAGEQLAADGTNYKGSALQNKAWLKHIGDTLWGTREAAPAAPEASAPKPEEVTVTSGEPTMDHTRPSATENQIASIGELKGVEVGPSPALPKKENVVLHPPEEVIYVLPQEGKTSAELAARVDASAQPKIDALKTKIMAQKGSEGRATVEKDLNKDDRPRGFIGRIVDNIFGSKNKADFVPSEGEVDFDAPETEIQRQSQEEWKKLKASTDYTLSVSMEGIETARYAVKNKEGSVVAEIKVGSGEDLVQVMKQLKEQVEKTVASTTTVATGSPISAVEAPPVAAEAKQYVDTFAHAAVLAAIKNFPVNINVSAKQIVDEKGKITIEMRGSHVGKGKIGNLKEAKVTTLGNLNLVADYMIGLDPTQEAERQINAMASVLADWKARADQLDQPVASPQSSPVASVESAPEKPTTFQLEAFKTSFEKLGLVPVRYKDGFNFGTLPMVFEKADVGAVTYKAVINKNLIADYMATVTITPEGATISYYNHSLGSNSISNVELKTVPIESLSDGKSKSILTMIQNEANQMEQWAINPKTLKSDPKLGKALENRDDKDRKKLEKATKSFERQFNASGNFTRKEFNNTIYFEQVPSAKVQKVMGEADITSAYLSIGIGTNADTGEIQHVINFYDTTERKGVSMPVPEKTLKQAIESIQSSHARWETTLPE